MIAILRLIGLGLLLGTVVFVALWGGLTAAKRDELSKAWEARGHPGPHGKFVSRGLNQWRARAFLRVLLAVYGTVLASLALIGYLAIQ